jgi:anti-sigma B factor antagonist
MISMGRSDDLSWYCSFTTSPEDVARRRAGGARMSGTMTLHPAAEFDLAQAGQLRADWYAAVDEREPELVIVDLSDVTFIDVAGLRVIAGLLRRQRERGASVAVSNASAMVLYLLQATSLSELLDDVDALAGSS